MNFADIRLRIAGLSFQVPKLCIHDSHKGHLEFFCLFVCLVITILFVFHNKSLLLQTDSSIQSLWEKPGPAELIYLMTKHLYGSQILMRTRRHQEKPHTHVLPCTLSVFSIGIFNKGSTSD